MNVYIPAGHEHEPLVHKEMDVFLPHTTRPASCLK